MTRPADDEQIDLCLKHDATQSQAEYDGDFTESVLARIQSRARRRRSLRLATVGIVLTAIFGAVAIRPYLRSHIDDQTASSSGGTTPSSDRAGSVNPDWTTVQFLAQPQVDQQDFIADHLAICLEALDEEL